MIQDLLILEFSLYLLTRIVSKSLQFVGKSLVSYSPRFLSLGGGGHRSKLGWSPAPHFLQALLAGQLG